MLCFHFDLLLQGVFFLTIYVYGPILMLRFFLHKVHAVAAIDSICFTNP